MRDEDSGYELEDGGDESSVLGCVRFDECTGGRHHHCHVNASCEDTSAPGFVCNCDPGFTGNGKNCSNIDECKEDGVQGCDENEDCTDTIGSFSCSCKMGYKKMNDFCEGKTKLTAFLKLSKELKKKKRLVRKGSVWPGKSIS